MPAITFEEILADYAPEIQQTALSIRRLVHAAVPNLAERVYFGWRGLGFRHPKAGYIGGIFPQRTTVRLLFEHGVQLSDPQGILTGDGRQTRYVEVKPGEPLPVQQIELLLLEAVQLRIK